MQRERQDWRRPEDATDFAGVNLDVGVLGLDESPSDLAGQVTAAVAAGALALLEYEAVDRATATDMVRPRRRLAWRVSVLSVLRPSDGRGTKPHRVPVILSTASVDPPAALPRHMHRPRPAARFC